MHPDRDADYAVILYVVAITDPVCGTSTFHTVQRETVLLGRRGWGGALIGRKDINERGHGEK
jgi:hypothetical protein